MTYEKLDKVTVNINRDLLEEASFKSGLNKSATVQMLLLDYVSVDGDIWELEKQKEESDKIINREQRRKKQIDKRIEEIEEEQKANGKNAIIINECLERIDSYYSKEGIITTSFLRRLSKAKRVEFGVLNDLCNQREYKVIKG